MKKLIFIHIPKSGGTTFRNLIYENFDRQNCFYFNANRIIEEVKRFKKKSKEYRNKFVSYDGHIGYGIQNYINSKNILVTFLRDPVERVISYWKHLKRVPNVKAKEFTGVVDKYKKDCINTNDVSFEEFIKGKYSYEISNGQLRHLASQDGNPLTFKQKENLTNKDLDRAKKTLKKEIKFGIVKYYPKSLLLIKKQLSDEGINFEMIYNERLNKSSNKINLTKKDIKLIREVNSLDIELYDFAVELFKKRLNYYFEDSELKKQFENLKTIERGKNNKLKEIKEKLNNIDFDSNVALYGAGEHTYQLLQRIDIDSNKFDYIIDTYQETGDILGIEIKNVNDIFTINPDVVVISTFSFQQEIYDLLTEKFKYNGQIIRLYNKDDTKAFNT